MIEIVGDDSSSPRICPVCGQSMASKTCRKDGIKTLASKTVSGEFVKILKEKNRLGNSEILKCGKFGYDLRIDFSKVFSRTSLSKDLMDFFSAFERKTKPDFMIFSRDHRKNGDFIEEIFRNYKSESDCECGIVKGHIPTTVSTYFGGVVSQNEEKKVTVLHATASHNPPEYNGVKMMFGKLKKNSLPSDAGFEDEFASDAVVLDYTDWVCSLPGFSGKVKFDLMNGAGNLVVPGIAKRLYPKASFLNDRISLDFGGLKPEPPFAVPWKEFGFAFDGDADRCPMYLGSKSIFFSTFLAGMVKEGLFSEKKIVSDQRTPPTIIEYLRSLGVKTVVGSIGRPNQQDISMKENSLWFEENWHSGGYPFGKIRLPWSESPFAIAFWLGRMTMPIEKILDGVPHFEQKEERFAVRPGFNERIETCADIEDYEVTRIPPDGGVRVQSENGHVLLRESNTELGVVKAFATGENKKILDELLEIGRKLVSRSEGH